MPMQYTVIFTAVKMTIFRKNIEINSDCKPSFFTAIYFGIFCLISDIFPAIYVLRMSELDYARTNYNMNSWTFSLQFIFPNLSFL